METNDILTPLTDKDHFFKEPIEDFELLNGERYGVGENKSIFALAGNDKIISTDVNYVDIGYIFDNPYTTNYLYGSSRNKITYDGRFDDYAIINVDLSIKEINNDKFLKDMKKDELELLASDIRRFLLENILEELRKQKINLSIISVQLIVFSVLTCKYCSFDG